MGYGYWGLVTSSRLANIGPRCVVIAWVQREASWCFRLCCVPYVLLTQDGYTRSVVGKHVVRLFIHTSELHVINVVNMR